MEHDTAPSQSSPLDWPKRRESKDIPLQAIAEQTNISLKKLEALEARQFDQLGTDTFVSGYIRAYAKAIGEDPLVYLADYKSTVSIDRENPAESREPSYAATAASGPGLSWKHVKRVKLLHVSLAVIGAWGILVWVLGGPGQEDKPDESVQAPVSRESEFPSDIVSRGPDSDELPSAAATMPVDEDIRPVEIDDLVLTDSEPADIADIDSPVTSPDLSAADPGVDQAPRSGVLEEDILVLSFSEDCWAEIKDRDGRVLIAELKRKGDNLQLFGQAPFSIMLGNARAVTLSINGDVVSTVPPGSRKTLRLVVE